jgi:hypothetical protein
MMEGHAYMLLMAHGSQSSINFLPFFSIVSLPLVKLNYKKENKMEVPFDLLKLAGGEGLLMFVVVAPAAARRLRDRTCGMRGMR